jgi:hypothetical protein
MWLFGVLFFTAEAQRKKMNYYLEMLSQTESKASVFTVALCVFLCTAEAQRKFLQNFFLRLTKLNLLRDPCLCGE